MFMIEEIWTHQKRYICVRDMTAYNYCDVEADDTVSEVGVQTIWLLFGYITLSIATMEAMPAFVSGPRRETWRLVVRQLTDGVTHMSYDGWCVDWYSWRYIHAVRSTYAAVLYDVTNAVGRGTMINLVIRELFNKNPKGKHENDDPLSVTETAKPNQSFNMVEDHTRQFQCLTWIITLFQYDPNGSRGDMIYVLLIRFELYDWYFANFLAHTYFDSVSLLS